MPVSLNYSCLATETKRYLFHYLIIVSVLEFKIYLILTFCNWQDNFSQTFNLCINLLHVIQSNSLPKIVLHYCPRIACTEETILQTKRWSLSWSGRTPAEITLWWWSKCDCAFNHGFKNVTFHDLYCIKMTIYSAVVESESVVETTSPCKWKWPHCNYKLMALVIIFPRGMQIDFVACSVENVRMLGTCYGLKWLWKGLLSVFWTFVGNNFWLWLPPRHNRRPR